jgi:hypothetical protein
VVRGAYSVDQALNTQYVPRLKAHTQFVSITFINYRIFSLSNNMQYAYLFSRQTLKVFEDDSCANQLFWLKLCHPEAEIVKPLGFLTRLLNSY